MKTSGDIERLRSAEKEALTIVAAANQEAQRIRSDTAARVAELTRKTESELASMRERGQSAGRGEADTLLAESREQVALACKEVSIRLEAGKAEAVVAVIKELKAL